MVLNCSLVLLLFSIWTPHFVWGFPLEPHEKFHAQVLEQKIFDNPQWLRLGHYQKTLSGKYFSKIKGHFFLAAEGAMNPQAELLATVDELFFKNKNSQCRYLARTQWLKSVLQVPDSELISCPERDEWKKKLSANEVYIVFASSDLNSPSSSFGHTFLRLHNPENTKQLELLDYGVNYAAVTGDDTGALFGLKGLLGYYPGNYSMLPYHQKIREYTNLEGRDLWEYKLKFTPAEVEFMINHLLELDGSFSYYYFADENCAYQILELLNVVRPKLPLTENFYDFVIPLDTLKRLASKDLLDAGIPRPSLQAEWCAHYAGLNLTQKKELQDLVKTPQAFKFSENLTVKEKATTLEAGMDYLAIKEYREQKELKDDKYALAVQRSSLGQITNPIEIEKPSSPLLSQNPMAIYLGYGKENQREYLDFKFRRAFHDLLSDDKGLSPFFHLEVMSFDFRYFAKEKNLDLYKWTFLQILSTAPTNILDHPLSWNLDLGTQPKASPYLHFGAGSSFDLPLRFPSRFVFLGRSENQGDTDNHYDGYAGLQSLLIQKWTPALRSLLDLRYLYSYKKSEFIWDQKIGLSVGGAPLEFRLEIEKRDQTESGQASLIYFL